MIRALLLLLIAMQLAGCGREAREPDPGRTRVWILTDGFAAEDFGAGLPERAPRLSRAMDRDALEVDLAPSTSLTASCASRLTGWPPSVHGLRSAKDKGAHRLHPSIPTVLEHLRTEGGRVFVSVARPQLVHSVAGLWRGASDADRCEPDSRSARVARTPRDVFEALRAHLSTARGDRGDWMVVAQVSCPEFPGGTPPPGAGRALARRLDAFTDAERSELADSLSSTETDTGFAKAVERFGRLRGTLAWNALREASREAWLAELDRGLAQLLEALEELGRADVEVGVTGLRGVDPVDSEEADRPFPGLRVAVPNDLPWRWSSYPFPTEAAQPGPKLLRGPQGERLEFRTQGPETGCGFVMDVPAADQVRRVLLRADEPVLWVEERGSASRHVLELESGVARVVFVPTLRRGVELTLSVLPKEGAAVGGRPPEPPPDARELGFALRPIGPPLMPLDDPQLGRFLDSLPSGE
jgi:hypothetical protein